MQFKCATLLCYEHKLINFVIKNNLKNQNIYLIAYAKKKWIFLQKYLGFVNAKIYEIHKEILSQYQGLTVSDIYIFLNKYLDIHNHGIVRPI